jgi:orotidine-5'-phosphate decarboxylase
MNARDRIILPLDVDTPEQAEALVRVLRDQVGVFKVGLQLINAAGPDVFERLEDAGAERIFYDCKLHDIPNTVAGASREIAKRGLWMFNVHASGGSRMVRAAVDAVAAAQPRPLVLGVTLLTSISEDELRDELHVSVQPAAYVTHLARLSRDAGANGVVASPHEIETVRAGCGPGFLIVTPGVRPTGSGVDDQRRTMPPGEAVRRGADYLVIGRPITAAQDPAAAAAAIAAEIEAV